MPAFQSIEEARRAFDDYVRIEPQLAPLWELCRRAAPAMHEQQDDSYDADPFEVDELAADHAAEDYFLQHVKPRLLLLAGAHRAGEPDELHSNEAYETLYDVLLHWATPG